MTEEEEVLRGTQVNDAVVERSHVWSRGAWNLGEGLKHITLHSVMALTNGPFEWCTGSNS